MFREEGCLPALYYNHKEMGSLSSQHEARYKDLITKHKASREEIDEALREEISRVCKEQDEKHGKGRVMLTSAVENLEKKLRDELAESSCAHDAKHKEIRVLLPQTTDALESKLQEALQSISKAHGEKHDQHASLHDRHAREQQLLSDELTRVAKEFDTRHRDHQVRARKDLDDVDSVLREDLAALLQRVDAEHRSGVAQSASSLESLQEELRHDLSKVAADFDEKHKMSSLRIKQGLEIVDTRLTESVAQLTKDTREGSGGSFAVSQCRRREERNIIWTLKVRCFSSALHCRGLLTEEGSGTNFLQFCSIMKPSFLELAVNLLKITVEVVSGIIVKRGPLVVLSGIIVCSSWIKGVISSTRCPHALDVLKVWSHVRLGPKLLYDSLGNFWITCARQHEVPHGKPVLSFQ